MENNRAPHGGSPDRQSLAARLVAPAFGWKTWFWPLLPCAGGLGLVAWVLSRQPMPAMFGGIALIGLVLWAVGWRRLDEAQRAQLRMRVLVGAQAGLMGVVAYDAARFGLVSLVNWSMEPWAAIPIFGRLFIGPDHSTTTLYAVGLLYHFLVNGMGFAIAYSLVIKRPSPITGVLWAFGLEAAMALLYPGFLIIKQYGEFLTMSVVGHVVYGLVIGWWARRQIIKRTAASPD